VQPTFEGIKAGILHAIRLPKPPPAPGRSWKDAARILARELMQAGSLSHLNEGFPERAVLGDSEPSVRL